MLFQFGMKFSKLFMINMTLISPSQTLIKFLAFGDRSQTLVRGGLMQKIFIAKIFRPPPPSDRNKISGPPFLPWKLRVNPIEKHVNSIFNGKSVVIFFRAPLTRVKNFKGPLFASGPPYKCLWTVPYQDNFLTYLFWCVKYYIYVCKFQNKKLNFISFKVFVKVNMETEHSIARKKDKLSAHDKKWRFDL